MTYLALQNNHSDPRKLHVQLGPFLEYPTLPISIYSLVAVYRKCSGDMTTLQTNEASIIHVGHPADSDTTEHRALLRSCAAFRFLRVRKTNLG